MEDNPATAAQPRPPAVSIPTKNDEPAPNRTKDSDSAFSHNGTHSSGYNSMAIKVPPLNLDGLSQSGAGLSLRAQMGRDEELEELNQRIRELEKENQQVRFI